MKTNLKTIIIISVSLLLVVAVGIGAFIWYKGRDRRALGKAFIRLSEDMESRSAELIPADDLADMIDEVVYGDSHMDFSVNASGLDLDGFIPVILPIDLDNVTIGLDGEMDRSCSGRAMSASGSVSVMNYNLTDLQAYLDGEDLYVRVPLLFDSVLSFYTGEDLFPDRESGVIPPVSGGIRGVVSDINRARDMWDDVSIERSKTREPFVTSDGTEYLCTVYNVRVPAAGDGSASGAGDEQEYAIYVDEFSDIRRIRVLSPINVDGHDICPAISLVGNDVPLDEIKVSDGDIKVHLTRDDGEYEVSVENGDHSLEGRFKLEYDAEAGRLRVVYNRLLLKIAGEEFLRSSGDITIKPGPTEITAIIVD